MVMLYVEPTPYVIALIDTLRHVWGCFDGDVLHNDRFIPALVIAT